MPSERPTSKSPPPVNSSIVNAGNLLPSVNVLFDEVRQRERSSSQSSAGSRPTSAWSGFPGPDRAFVGHANPAVSRHQLPPLQVGPRMTPQASPQLRPGPNHTFIGQPIAYNESPAARAQEAPLPVIPNRMGGRYAQTPCHSNGQPHAPGVISLFASAFHRLNFEFLVNDQVFSRPSPGPTRFNPGRGAPATNGPPSNEATTRVFQGLLAAAGNPSCPHCVHDLKIESRRQIVGTQGPSFSKFAHGIKPQVPTPLPQIQGLITIPFTPKALNNHAVSFGVSLIEILDFRDVLESPRERVLDDALNNITLTIELPGFPVVVKQIAGNCPHRPVSRFNLAFSTNQYNPSMVPPGTPFVIRSVTQIRLVNLYTTDKINYRAHVAYVF
ncbi:hypothetical protein MSAN_02200300 [Mycena sanguinolenta]|uniref:Uncharacterized protein n=1 Tax=Mycena sanguinolenta TaxID=230812 RepID=A0A8H6XCF8_9AGAR|nr:hypothetical protein MSAN_02200300 [Mycena sanguinolenta]